jgi:hypothetical protein
MALFDHPAEKILVLAHAKLWPKREFTSFENVMVQQYIPGACLEPLHNRSRPLHRTFVKVALDQPVGRFTIEVALHRPQHPVDVIVLTGIEQSQQPILRRKLIVVDQSDEIAAGVFDCLIARSRDTLLRLHTILDWDAALSGKLRHRSSCRLQLIVVGNHNGESESTVGSLASQLLQQSLQALGPLISADANTDMIHFF